MEVTLIHNPKSGDKSVRKRELIREFERAGYDVIYQSVKGKRFPGALDKPGDMVVIAGGDGTVRKVARRLIGRNVPIAILPLGTANNIGRALGLGRTPRQLIRDLARARPVRFDVGIARGPWGDEVFLEGAGIGLFPRMMSDLESDQENGIAEAIDAESGIDGGVRFMRRVLETFRGRDCVVKLDGREHSGRYLLVEAMNIPSIGPSVELAPSANHADGLLDVVLIKEKERHDLRRHLAGRSRNRKMAPFVVRRVRQLRLTCSASDFHFDDQWWPPRSKKKKPNYRPIHRDISVEIEVFPGALRMLVP